MSYSIRFDDGSDGGEVFSLATTRGLMLLGEWAESLPDRYRAVRSLLSDGAVAGTRRLSRELRVAMRDDPPEGAVIDTVKGLMELLGVGDEDEVAVIVLDDEPSDKPDDDDPIKSIRRLRRRHRTPRHPGGRKPFEESQHPRGSGGRFRVKGSKEYRDLLKEQAKESADLAKEIRKERKELPREQARERTDLLKEQAKEARELRKEQRKEASGLPREQAKERRDLRKEASKEVSDLRKEHGKGPDKGDGETDAEFAARRLEERSELAESIRVRRTGLAEEHRQARADLAETIRADRQSQREEHAEARELMAEDHREAIASQRRDHLEAVGDIEERHRSELADIRRDELEMLREHRDGGR